MKKVPVLLFFSVCLSLLSLLVHAQVNVVTYNIRYNNPGDGEHAWPDRKADVINLLKFHLVDIFCLQEALEGQVKEVDAAFPDFTYVGVGRDDGKSAGDFNLPPSSEPIRKLAAYLDDAYQVTELPPHGATGTWSGFTYEAEKGDRIDYIFVSDDLRVKRYAALTDSRDKSFFSDHLPVFVEIGWR